MNLLISVWDKTGLSEFLARLGEFHPLSLVGTSSTADFLKQSGFEARRVEDVTRFPEILGGRVKTLHPRIFAGILARTSEEDRSTLADHDIPSIDLVIVNLYPFEEKSSSGLSEQDLVEFIDVGGVSLLRAAAKNFDRVAVVCGPHQYERVLEELKRNQGEFSHEFRRELAREAFARTAAYDMAIGGSLSGAKSDPGAETGAAALRAPASATASGAAPANGVPEAGGPVSSETVGAPWPRELRLKLHLHAALRYGENPHQEAAWYFPQGGPPFEQLQGKEMSSNNLLDTRGLISLLRELPRPAAAIVKHANPCGVAAADTLEEAYRRAYDCDPLSAFGGIYGLTGRVEAALAEQITGGFVEIVAAPDFSPGALEVFRGKKNLRVLRLAPGALERAGSSRRMRDLGDLGWVLERDPGLRPRFEVVSGAMPEEAWPDVAFAWAVVAQLTSNAIFVARDRTSLGFGLGQTSRVGSVKLALAQAGERARGAVLASDGFFPAVDNIEQAAAAGIRVIVQPGGSVKDPEVLAASEQAGITMIFTGVRCFRH